MCRRETSSIFGNACFSDRRYNSFKFRHHSVDDEFYHSSCNGYEHEKYGNGYRSHPSAQRDGKYQHPNARFSQVSTEMQRYSGDSCHCGRRTGGGDEGPITSSAVYSPNGVTWYVQQGLKQFRLTTTSKCFCIRLSVCQSAYTHISFHDVVTGKGSLCHGKVELH